MRIAVFASFAVFALALAGCSGQPSFQGQWTIERVEVAPWVDAGFAPDASIAGLYVGKAVAFKTDAIEGPALLACAHPRYTFEEVPAEGLFQGSLAGSHRDTAGAETAARKLGFAPPVKTMMTGCEHDIAFHMRDEDHAAFALDNMIFWMVRAR